MWNSSFLIHCIRFPNFVHFNPFSIFKLFSDSLKFQLSNLPLGNRTEYPISSIFLISKLFFEYGKTIARCSISSQEFTKRDCLTMNHFIIWRTSSNFSRIKISTIYLFFFNPQFFQILQQRRFIVKSTKTWSSYTPSSFNQNANLCSSASLFKLKLKFATIQGNWPSGYASNRIHNETTNRHGCRADYDCVCPRRDKRRRAPLLRTSNRQKNILVASIVPLPVSWPPPSIIFPLLYSTLSR